MNKPTFVPCGKCTDGIIFSMSGAALCHCLKEHEKRMFLYERFEQSNIPVKYENCTVDNYEVLNGSQTNLNSVNLIKWYLYEMDAHFKEGDGLVLMGPNDCGKTHLAAATLLETIRRGHSAYFVILTSFINMVTKTWSTRDYADIAEIERIKNVDLLCLDDLDKTAVQSVAFKKEILDELLRYREGRRLPIIITTNILNKEGLLSLLEASMTNLIERTMKFLRFEGDYTRVLQAKMEERYHVR